MSAATPTAPWPTTPCAFCPKSVVFADTGKTSMPVNPDPVPGGNIVLLAAPGAPRAVLTTDPGAYPDQPRYLAHFVDCPGAAKARRRGRVTSRAAAPAPPAQTLF